MMDVWPHILFNRIKGYFVQSHKRTWSPPGPHWYKISALIARPAIQTSLPPLLNVKEAMFCAAPSLSRLMRMPVSPVLGSGCGWSAGWVPPLISQLSQQPGPSFYLATVATSTIAQHQRQILCKYFHHHESCSSINTGMNTCNARNVLIRVGVRKYPVNMRIFINRHFPLRLIN